MITAGRCFRQPSAFFPCCVGDTCFMGLMLWAEEGSRKQGWRLMERNFSRVGSGASRAGGRGGAGHSCAFLRARARPVGMGVAPVVSALVSDRSILRWRHRLRGATRVSFRRTSQTSPLEIGCWYTGDVQQRCTPFLPFLSRLLSPPLLSYAPEGCR